ncbi:MAG: hypothetical protein MAG794_01021 [Gammaproteobacteria bacterium]|nr:hypothetical protein [Gammaproteobacteria bacterium]
MKSLSRRAAATRLGLLVLAALVSPVTTSGPGIEVVEVTQHGGPERGATGVTYPVAVLLGAGWKREQIERAIGDTEAIYARCGVVVTAGAIYWLQAPDDFQVLDEAEQTGLLTKLEPERPAAVFVNQTTDGDIAYSYLESAPIAGRGTAWITRNSDPTCIGALLAHELGHIMLDAARHSSQPGNLMAHTCTHSNIAGATPNTALSEAQCRRLRARR